MTFLNIFSKTKTKKPKAKPKIIVDTREKNSLVPILLQELDCQIEYKHLPVADYLINNTAIERKTLSDFKSSIVNKRIMRQLLEIQQYPKYLLILEGFETPDSHIIHENAFRGFLLSVALEYRVPIIFTTDAEDTAKYLLLLAKKALKPSTEISIRPSKILRTKKEQAQFILEGFPYIGPTKAKKLLKKFKSLKNIINAPLPDLKEILGKRAEELKSLLDYQFK